MFEVPDGLRISFFVHFLLSTWGNQGYWHPDSYFFYNLVFLFAILWTIINKDNPDGPLLSLLINLLAILMDVIVISVYFPGSRFAGSSERFSAVMAVFNLAARPVTSIVLYRQWKERNLELGLPDPEIGVTERGGYASM